ncbi:Hypothetical predicted protein [Xyrichtys novacula]|uniref:Uncharacterized protein n=1 Tax=Xyrichtys novacula TaxID=13765 RepID=A0AAV1F8U2_XYRNO|nr:Hypothetical predicted protein [Xyrichtys novacula]
MSLSLSSPRRSCCSEEQQLASPHLLDTDLIQLSVSQRTKRWKKSSHFVCSTLHLPISTRSQQNQQCHDSPIRSRQSSAATTTTSFRTPLGNFLPPHGSGILPSHKSPDWVMTLKTVCQALF